MITNRGEPKYAGKNVQCCFGHHKSHMDWPGIERGPKVNTKSIHTVKSQLVPHR